MGLVEDFAELFEGRRDAFGIADGGCLRSQSPWLAFVDDHLVGRMPIGVYPMVERYAPHKMMRGDEPPHGWYVKWGCVDFDIKSEAHKSWDYEHEDEAHIAAVNLQKTLRHLGVTSWVERTRSSGRHVWVFVDSWCTATTIRRALLVACSVAGVSAREVNPKQETLAEGQLGNYVRTVYPNGLNEWGVAGGPSRRGRFVLPDEGQVPSDLTADDRSRRSGAGEESRIVRWGDLARPQVCARCGSPWLRGEGHLPLARTERSARGGVDDDAVPTDGRASSGEDPRVPRQVAIDSDGSPLCLTCFVTEALDERTSPHVLEKIAAKWREPERVRSTPTYLEEALAYDGSLDGVLPDLNEYGCRVFWEGPDEGEDRSGALMRLARACARSGLTPTSTYLLLENADERWGKFSGRSDRDKRLKAAIEKVWTT